MAYISKAVLPPVIEAIEKKLAEHAVPRPSDDGLKLDLTEARLYCDKLLHRLRLYEAEFDKRGIPHPLGSSSENILDSLTDELGGPETYATHFQGTLGQLRTQARQLRVESNCWAREWAYYFYVTEALWKMIEDGEVRLAAPWRTEMAEIEAKQGSVRSDLVKDKLVERYYQLKRRADEGRGRAEGAGTSASSDAQEVAVLRTE